MDFAKRRFRSALSVLLLVVCAASGSVQTVTVTRNVNLRPEQSSAEPPIRLLTPSEPPMERPSRAGVSQRENVSR